MERPEIGSENWIKAEIAAGRIPQERDRCECGDGGHADPNRVKTCLCGGRIER